MRVLVCGDRNWCCSDLADRLVERIRLRHGPGVILVHGAAAGVDSAFASAATVRGLGVEAHPADWDAHGKAGGPRRNQEMVDAGADFVLAVHRDLAGSKGTADCCRRSLKAGIPVFLIDAENGEPRRITEI